MRTDPELSKFQEDPEARRDFSRQELRHLRFLLRRLRFLETKEREGATGSEALFRDLEAAALEFALTELGFLTKKKVTR